MLDVTVRDWTLTGALNRLDKQNLAIQMECQMINCEKRKPNAYVNLSIEALWLARAIQDALDILLGEPTEAANADRDRTKVLAISRGGRTLGSLRSQLQ
jgi:hypothetical protein